MTEKQPFHLFPRRQTGVPRRFGVGVMLVITTMYAVLFAVIQRASAWNFAVIAIFFTLVGLAQAVLFKGRNPRRASAVTGVVFGVLLVLVSSRSVPILRQLAIPCPLPLAILLGAVSGALFGYLAGGLIAGVFLFLNKVQTPLDDPADEKPADGTEQGAPGVRRGDRPQQDTPA